MILVAGLFVVLWLNLRRPVREMVASINAGRELPTTGIEELDGIGAAVNLAMERVRTSEEHVRLLLNSTAEGSTESIPTASARSPTRPA